MQGFITKLRPHLERLQKEERKIKIFFRDDDVDVEGDTLTRLLDLFLSQGVPINLEIIPKSLTDPAIKLLHEYKRSHGSILELNQHGWQHLNHERVGKKCEFGISRGLDEQLEDISRGKSRLEEIFGHSFYPVFTPPWNRCTVDTFRVLDQLCFRVLSKDMGKQPIKGYSFMEISTTLDLFSWKGGAALKPPEKIVGELISQMGVLPAIGILLHHKVMDAEVFSLLETLIEELKQYPIVKFYTFQGLIESAEKDSMAGGPSEPG